MSDGDSRDGLDRRAFLTTAVMSAIPLSGCTAARSAIDTGESVGDKLEAADALFSENATVVDRFYDVYTAGKLPVDYTPEAALDRVSAAESRIEEATVLAGSEHEYHLDQYRQATSLQRRLLWLFERHNRTRLALEPSRSGDAVDSSRFTLARRTELRSTIESFTEQYDSAVELDESLDYDRIGGLGPADRERIASYLDRVSVELVGLGAIYEHLSRGSPGASVGTIQNAIDRADGSNGYAEPLGRR